MKKKVVKKKKKEDKGINPKDLLGLKKVPMRYLSPVSLVLQTIPMHLGGEVKGYGPFNWRSKKVRYSVYLEAIFRHLLLAMDGEDIDEESLGAHELSIAACCSIIMDAKHTGNLVDDRYKSGTLKPLMKDVEKLLKQQAKLYKKKK